MKRVTSLVGVCAGIVLPAILVGSDFTQAVQPAGSTYELQVTGRAGVPADATAVALNITSADARGTGFVSAYPCGSARPNASNLNYGVGAPIANSAIVKVGTGGKVCLYTADSDTELIADVNGWFPANSGYTSTSPMRLLDTRPGLKTVDGVADGEGLRSAGSTTELQVTGRAGVPGNAAAVVLNVTSAEARGTGFATAYPCGAARPVASNLNYGVGAPIANSAIVKVGTGGKVCLFTADTGTQLIADVNGWFPANSGYTSTSPVRLLDTRPGLKTVDGTGAGIGLRRAGSIYQLQVTGRAGVPANATAVVLNLTSAEARGTGFATAYPCGTTPPTASNLNYGVGAPIANSAIVKVGTGGKVCLLTADTDTELIADVNGWFTSGYTSISPVRLLDTRNPSTPPSGAMFAETFTGNTGMERFRSGVFHRNTDSANYPEGTGGTWLADHDLSCGAPTTYRTINADNRADALFMCKDHMMTTMGDVDGYSVVWFTPIETFTNVRRVCWDVNLTNMGNRQWWEVAVQPVSAPDLSINDGAGLSEASHLPARSPSAIVATMGMDDKLRINDTVYPTSWDAGNDKATRFEHCLIDNGNGTSTFTQQRPNGPVSVTTSQPFPSGQVEVIFKDHNYTPDKSEFEFQRPAYTWHWDNIIVG